MGIQPGRPLGAKLRKEPRLEGGDYSQGLRDLVAFVLEGRPNDRPSMEAVLKQPYILNSGKKYPTNSLTELITTYYRWEQAGGQRQSLFVAGGAAGAEFPETLGNSDSWNFSTTANFEQQFAPSTTQDQDEATSNLTYTTASTSTSDSTFTSYPVQDNFDYLSSPPCEPFSTPQKQTSASSSMSDINHPATTMSPEEKADVEERVKRGEKAMQGLFDENKAPYEYVVKDDFIEAKAKQPTLERSHSDLPLRSDTDRSSARYTQIDLGEFDPSLYETTPNIDLGNVPTIKASRRNRSFKEYDEEDEHAGMPYGGLTETGQEIKDWKFPSSTDTHASSDNETGRRLTQEWSLGTAYKSDSDNTTERRATKDWKFPTLSSDRETEDKHNRRATQEWKFPTMVPEATSDTTNLTRPTLKQTATAPVGELATMAATTNFERLTIADDISPFTAASHADDLHSAAKNDHEAAHYNDDPPRPSTADSDTDYDPFKFDYTVDKAADDANINAYLDEVEQLTDPMERVARRRELRRQKARAMTRLQSTVEAAGHAKFAASRVLTMPSFVKNQALWDKYDPDKNPAPTDRPGPYPFGLPARIDDEDHPLNRGLLTLGRGAEDNGGEGSSGRGGARGGRGGRGAPVAAARVGGVRRGGGGGGGGGVLGGRRGGGGRGRVRRGVVDFPEPIPPSAASLAQDAPPEVVEAELRRLVTDWGKGLAVLGRAFAGEFDLEEGEEEGEVEDENDE